MIDNKARYEAIEAGAAAFVADGTYPASSWRDALAANPAAVHSMSVIVAVGERTTKIRLGGSPSGDATYMTFGVKYVDPWVTQEDRDAFAVILSDIPDTFIA